MLMWSIRNEIHGVLGWYKNGAQFYSGLSIHRILFHQVFGALMCCDIYVRITIMSIAGEDTHIQEKGPC